MFSDFYSMTRRSVLVFLSSLALAMIFGAAAQADEEVLVYKNESCGCCNKWVDHMRANGFKVKTSNLASLATIKTMAGVRPQFEACHTALVGDYVVEGHVPAADVKRLLKERPPIAGLAVPGMPQGSPGMEGPTSQPYQVLGFDKEGATTVYSTH